MKKGMLSEKKKSCVAKKGETVWDFIRNTHKRERESELDCCVFFIVSLRAVIFYCSLFFCCLNFEFHCPSFQSQIPVVIGNREEATVNTNNTMNICFYYSQVLFQH